MPPVMQYVSMLLPSVLTTAIMFILIRQVKLEKRLDVAGAAKVWIEKMPDLIEQEHARRSRENADK